MGFPPGQEFSAVLTAPTTPLFFSSVTSTLDTDVHVGDFKWGLGCSRRWGPLKDIKVMGGSCGIASNEGTVPLPVSVSKKVGLALKSRSCRLSVIPGKPQIIQGELNPVIPFSS